MKDKNKYNQWRKIVKEVQGQSAHRNSGGENKRIYSHNQKIVNTQLSKRSGEKKIFNKSQNKEKYMWLFIIILGFGLIYYFVTLLNTIFFLLAIILSVINVFLLVIWLIEFTKFADNISSTSLGGGDGLISCPFCHSSISPRKKRQGGVLKSTAKGAVFLPWGVKEILKKDSYYCPKCGMKISEA